MQVRHMMPFVGILCLSGALAQDKPANAQAPAGSQPVIKTETKLVLVDTVVTDKKGAYIHDLELKNFRVWEDNKEVTVKSFSFEMRLYETDSMTHCATQKTVEVCFDTEKRASAHFPGDIHAKLAAMVPE